MKQNHTVRHLFTYILYTGVWYGNLRERDNSEDLGVNRREVLKLILEKWIDLAHDRDKQRVCVNTGMTLRVA